MIGNFYENNMEMGRYDADYGSMLINKAARGFSCEPLNGLAITGQARRIKKISIAGRDAFIIVKNNDSTMVIQFDTREK
jgi:hypothetical protein